MRDIITKLEKLNEGLGDMAHEAEKDHEVQMARSDCYKSAKYAVSIHKMLKDVSEMEGIDGWVASKLTKAADYLGSVKHYMEGQMMQDVELAVVPVAGDMTDAMTMPQESIAEGRLSMRQLASMDKDKVRQIEAMVGPESKYADMGDYQEALYNAARKMGLVESKIDEGYEKMVANALKDAGISHDGFKDGFLRIDQDDMKAARKAIKDADMDPPKMIAEELSQAKLDRINAAPGRTIDDMSPLERDSLKRSIRKNQMNPDGSLANQSEPSKAFFKKMGYDKLMGVKIEDAVEEEDVIGNIIAKLPNQAVKGNKQADVIGNIIAKLPKDPDMSPGTMPDTSMAPAPATPRVPMQAKQKMANKMALPKSKPDMSMGQDKTTGDPRGILRQSKFAEWSKK
tara:strand:+ start:865 stop:2058 length:1194 start_codon:yes stop_codon:yes gene_type:complete